ncbi:MAG: HAD family hydrolase [Candidatus Hodarchaeales archaeon]
MKIGAVVFDFDGTVVNSMPFLETIAVNLMTDVYGLSDEDARNKYILTSGLPFLEQIETLFPGNEANERVISAFEKEKHEGLFKQPVFPDTEEILAYLKPKPYKTFISSSSLKESIEEYLYQSGLLKYIDEVMGYRSDFQKGKDHFNHIIKKYNLDSEDIVFIGDSLKDYERARLSSVLFIGKLGLFSREDFLKSTSDSEGLITISNLSELKQIL